jgi:hypothetical protein
MSLSPNTETYLMDKKKDPTADLTVSKSGTVIIFITKLVYQDTSIWSKSSCDFSNIFRTVIQ